VAELLKATVYCVQDGTVARKDMTFTCHAWTNTLSCCHGLQSSVVACIPPKLARGNPAHLIRLRRGPKLSYRSSPQEISETWHSRRREVPGPSLSLDEFTFHDNFGSHRNLWIGFKVIFDDADNRRVCTCPTALQPALSRLGAIMYFHLSVDSRTSKQ